VVVLADGAADLALTLSGAELVDGAVLEDGPEALVAGVVDGALTLSGILSGAEDLVDGEADLAVGVADLAVGVADLVAGVAELVAVVANCYKPLQPLAMLA
jgi:X-X-X-Leu-X-X-Gly heptad repeat protein